MIEMGDILYCTTYMKIISAAPVSLKGYISNLIAYRRLVVVFALQELAATYAQTYLGLLWAVFKPIITLAVFTVIFRHFLKVDTLSPYYLFAFSGMIAWNLFSQVAVNASTAVIHKQHVIRKMYFPKLVLIFSKVLIALTETFISLLILCVFLFMEGLNAGFNWLALPLFVLLNVFCGLCIAVWMNAITIRFRDLYQLVPTIISIGIWITPVFYPTTIIPQAYNFLVYANPMAGIIKGYRFALLNEPFPELQYWYAIAVMVIVAVAGLFFFCRVEDEMADYA